ncbi:hypothetical protein BVC93_25655 [Mycobacterium sp. MS1601]|uniref:tripartite tricarboxylate transporter substrate-binding protein n=1 Tax=Mycobacterium sp. MS1601 TaxID=1936029 RepID=UPI0009796991|nr:tripartite tricarboxylate transporter substrate-binding protein [Mycobacterium sp. MS1601]AQA05219.1 hypothetical protein BVC93_25655 [Mycobacterium sp. MS1601]
MTIKAVVGALLAGVLMLVSQSAPAVAAEYPAGPVTMTAGANPGSGFDLTIQAVVDTLTQEHLVDVPLPVEYRPGNVGADFLATMVQQYAGRDDQVSVTSLSMMMNQLRGISQYGYNDVTMIANLMTEYYVVFVEPGSEFTDLAGLLTAVSTDPGRVVVGAATDDEAPFDLLVRAAGGDPSATRYLSLQGGGDQSAALRSGEIGVAVAGVSEVVDLLSTRQLIPLAVLAEQRLPGLDAPTARELGFDVTLSNWRGLYGPPGMPQFAVDYWRQVLARMVATPTWSHIAEQRQFTTRFMTGDEYETFLAETQADVTTALGEAGR